MAGSGGAEWGAGPPGVESDEVDCGGEQDVFQGDFGQASVAGAACVAGLDGLGDGAFHSGAGGVVLPPGLGLLLATATDDPENQKRPDPLRLPSLRTGPIRG